MVVSQHQAFPFIYILLIQYVMVSAFWREDASEWDLDSKAVFFQKPDPFAQNRNPCYSNYYSQKCRLFRKLVYGGQSANEVSDDQRKFLWTNDVNDPKNEEREKKGEAKLSLPINIRICPCEYNATIIDLGENDYFPSKIKTLNCGFRKNVHHCTQNAACQTKKWSIDVLKRQTAPSSIYTRPPHLVNIIPNDLMDTWEVESVETTVACVLVPKRSV